MTDKERDDALIAEAYRRSMEDAEYDKTLSGSAILELRCRHLLRLERSGWKPKPDRAEVLFDECGNWSKAEQLAIIRRHFDELRAEWEAERPAVVVPFGDDVIAAARFYADVPVAESRIVIMANAILDGAKGGA